MEEILNEVVTQDELEVRIVLKTNTVVIIYTIGLFTLEIREKIRTRIGVGWGSRCGN